MKRRKFITLIGGAAAWPVTVQAQQPATPVIGFLSSRSKEDTGQLLASYYRGLREVRYVEGMNVSIEYRWADGQLDRLPALAELVARRVRLISTFGSETSALAAKAATNTIPIVFTIASDPVEIGLVSSMNRPEANVTGVNALTSALIGKRLELLREIMPNARRIAFVANSNINNTDFPEAQASARAIGFELELFKPADDGQLEPVFIAMRDQGAEAFCISLDPFFAVRHQAIIALAARYSIPAVYNYGFWVSEGGLISYGPDLADGYRLAGVYAGKILNGAKPTDLPVIQPTKFELIINLKTAKAIGLDIPPTLLARADEVIE
jgi:putative ABC transport system substrate-binding protein